MILRHSNPSNSLALNQKHYLLRKSHLLISKTSPFIISAGNQKLQPLSNFLPYEPKEKTKERLKNGLNEYLLLLDIAEQAMLSFQQGNLSSFDPLVGENACQIRAVKIALIARQGTINPELFIEEIRSAKAIVEGYINSCPNFTTVEMSLREFLDNEKIDIQLSEDERFLIKSFALTKTKVVQPFFKEERPLVENAYTDSKKLKEIGQVGSSFSGELVKELRKKLSAKSVEFIQQLTRELKDIDPKLLSDQYVYLHNGLKCLPYYLATRVLMLHALESQIPIVMLAQQFAKNQDYKLIKTTQLFFQPTAQGYQKACSSTLDHESPVIVLIGSTCRDLDELPDLDDWTKELTEQCPIDLVLAYAAAHRQYPDESKDQMLKAIVNKHYEYHKSKAEEWGCSLENPSRFFLTHAFCDMMKNVNDRFNSLETVS